MGQLKLVALRSYKMVLYCSIFMCLLLVVCFHYNVCGYFMLRAYFLKMVENNKRVITNTNVTDVWTHQNGGKERTLFEVNNSAWKSTDGTIDTQWITNITISVLWYNKPNYINLTFANKALQSTCSYSNCNMFTDETVINNFTAVIFSVTDPLDSNPPIPSTQRNPNQVWIFFSLEPPVGMDYLSYGRSDWTNTMNWSMSYNVDSDVFFPYGQLKAREDMEFLRARNYSELFLRKTKQVGWIVSHCGAPSRRDEYVNELRRFGVEVEVFGKCVNRYVRDQKQLTDYIQKKFKFLLSFENNFCKDYISEKFFSFYNLDVVLVVRGGGDYDKLLPTDTFINSAHFISPQSLASYLMEVGSSETLFTKYLREKDKYIATDLFSLSASYCSLCEKLNRLDENRITYVDHMAYRHNGSCWLPDDIQF